jgi:S1-C subfamily serine protease
LREGDQIVALNDQALGGIDELLRFLTEWPLERPVKLTFLRGTEKLECQVTPVEYGT